MRSKVERKFLVIKNLFKLRHKKAGEAFFKPDIV